MKKQDNQPKYIAYIRKSEEREERQQLSISSQMEKIQEQFPQLSIIDKDRYKESRSAFIPDNRPLFDEMIDRIQKGEVHGILAWHPNRLARNEMDAARITYLVRTGIIKDLKFCTYNFENTPEGIMMLQMVMSQSQYESSSKGRDVKRGMNTKAKNGERPGRVGLGYTKTPVLDKDGKLMMHKERIVTETADDSERYDLVGRMWYMLLSGIYTAPQIHRIATKEWKLTLPKTERMGGGLISLSTVYRIFNNPFYAGWIQHNGEWYKGNHNAMITLEEFDQAQRLLGKKGKPRIGVFDYSYSAMIKCGECQCNVVAKTVQKFNKTENRMVTFVYYHCTRKSSKRPCRQSSYTKLETLENNIMTELSKYTILPEFRDLALEMLRRDNDLEIRDRSQMYSMQQKRRNQIQADLDGLVDMKLHGQLEPEEYMTKRNILKQEIVKLDETLRDTEKRADNWLQLTEEAFDFATHARAQFAEGCLYVKLIILMTLGENFELKDKRLYLKPKSWLVEINNGYPAVEAEYKKVRTIKKASPKAKEEALAIISSSWWACWDSNPGHEA